ncbi:MAG: hypothetical protein KL840_08105 [Aquamicrobium sp.]|nr:hypothetical protein [Aquamicrobium sp.]
MADRTTTTTRTISGLFGNRESADSAVERSVQEYGLKRTNIFVAAGNACNSAGETASGGDAGGKKTEPTVPLRGAIKVSVDISLADIPAAEGTFRQFGASEI